MEWTYNIHVHKEIMVSIVLVYTNVCTICAHFHVDFGNKTILVEIPRFHGFPKNVISSVCGELFFQYVVANL